MCQCIRYFHNDIYTIKLRIEEDWSSFLSFCSPFHFVAAAFFFFFPLIIFYLPHIDFL